jgi:hypothetical protein
MHLSLRSAAALLLVAGTMIALPLVRAQQSGQPDNNTRCLSNAKQVALAALMYAQDYDERLPPMKSAAQTQNLLNPYLKNKTLFTCPATQKPYVFNTRLSGMNTAKIAKPASTPLFCDAQAHGDGKWTVAYTDGHVKRETTRPSAFAPSNGGKKMKPTPK